MFVSSGTIIGMHHEPLTCRHGTNCIVYDMRPVLRLKMCTVRHDVRLINESYYMPTWYRMQCWITCIRHVRLQIMPVSSSTPFANIQHVAGTTVYEYYAGRYIPVPECKVSLDDHFRLPNVWPAHSGIITVTRCSMLFPMNTWPV
jgi:hypothetical protein